METSLFSLRCFLATRNPVMTRRSLYLDKANACVDAAKRVHDLKECIELLQVSERFIILAEHVAKFELHARKDEHQATLHLP